MLPGGRGAREGRVLGTELPGTARAGSLLRTGVQCQPLSFPTLSPSCSAHPKPTAWHVVEGSPTRQDPGVLPEEYGPLLRDGDPRVGRWG